MQRLMLEGTARVFWEEVEDPAVPTTWRRRWSDPWPWRPAISTSGCSEADSRSLGLIRLGTKESSRSSKSARR